MKKWILFAGICAALGGCATGISERHHLKSVDAGGQTVNYYRLKIDGWTFLSSSRYLSGYFDESAVNQYFSEFRQPTTLPVTRVVGKDSETKVVPLERGDDQSSLVLILSSNSDAVAEGINAISNTEQITVTLGRIVARERITAAGEASLETTALKDKAAAIKEQWKKSVEALKKPDATVDAQNAELLKLANRLAGYLHPGRSFKSLKEAATWFENNRDVLLTEKP